MVWVIVVATLLGPVLAVQAQKWLERLKKRGEDKEQLFRTLMSTRSTRISEDHVEALNMIDVVFRAGHPQGRSFKENTVLNKWVEYRGHLNTGQRPVTDIEQAQWTSRANDLFLELLQAMADERGYQTNKHELQVGGYFPVAHEYVQNQQEALRMALIKVLAGHQPVAMTIKEMPGNTDWNDEVLESLKGIKRNTDSR